MTYDTTNLRLSVMDRLRTNTGRNPKLDRDIDIVLGVARRCDDPLRYNDNYVMSLHRHDYRVANRWTSSIDLALSVVRESKRDELLSAALDTGDAHWRGERWKALPSLIVYQALIGQAEHGLALDLAWLQY